MARYRTLTRVSMLGLLILIVTIGLTAICILTLASTHANAALTDRQAAIASETYAEEMVGQTFLSSLDKQLIPSKKAGRVKNGFNSSLRPQLQGFANEACAKVAEDVPDVDLSATAKLLTIKELYAAMEISFDLRDDFDMYDEDDDRAQTSESEYYYSLAKVLDDCVSGVELNVKSSSGRILNALIGIQADGNYVILSWEVFE